MTYNKYKEDIHNFWRYPMGPGWPPDELTRAISLYVSCTEHASVVGIIYDMLEEINSLEVKLKNLSDKSNYECEYQ